MQLDLDFIRQQFPAFDVPSLDGQSFFENAGGSYTCAQVQDRLFRFYRVIASGGSVVGAGAIDRRDEPRP